MKNIRVKWDVNVSRGTESFSLEDLGLNSEEEWNALDKDAKSELLQNALYDLPERTFLVLDRWEDD